MAGILENKAAFPDLLSGEKKSIEKTEKEITFDGFSLEEKSGKCCVTAKNCTFFAGGEVSPAYAFTAAGVEGLEKFTKRSVGSIKRVAFPSIYGENREEDAVLLDSDKKLYYYDKEKAAWEDMGVSFELLPNVAVYTEKDGAESALFFGDKIVKVKKGGKAETLAEGIKKPFVCVSFERIFYISGEKSVRFSAVGGVNFEDSADEGGEIAFPETLGILGVFAAGKYVYIFFPFAIYRLDARGAARDFVAEKIAYTGGEILENSIAVCGETLCFLAEDSGYTLSGKTFERFIERVGDFSSIEGVYAIAAQGKYLFEINGKNENGGEKCVQKMYDAAKKTCVDVDLSAQNSYVYGNTAYFLGDSVQKITFDGSGSEEKEYLLTRKGEDFGANGLKTVGNITLYGRGKVRLMVSGGRYGSLFDVELTKTGVRVAVNITAETFDFALILKGGSRVNGVKLTIKK